MKKLLLIITFFSTIAFANAQLLVTMFINGNIVNNMASLTACNDSCYNVTLTVSGGQQPYTFLWNNGATTQTNFYCSANMQTYNDSISVRVTDANSALGWGGAYLPNYLNFCQDICIVTIDSATNKNIIVWNQASDTTVKSYNIYKETSVTNVWDLIGNVPKGNLSTFIDTSTNPSQVSARYTIKAYNNCAETMLCSVHKTMHLNINQGMGNTWNLMWEPYQGIPISSYKIYRGTTANNLQLIASTASSNTSYTDLSAPSGYVYYQIEIDSYTSCSPSKSYNTSKSNIATNSPNSINEILIGNLVNIFPNPVTGNLTIEAPQKSIIEILNIEGQIIKTFNQTDEVVTINLSDLARGIYAIKANTDNGSTVKKFIKE